MELAQVLTRSRGLSVSCCQPWFVWRSSSETLRPGGLHAETGGAGDEYDHPLPRNVHTPGAAGNVITSIPDYLERVYPNRCCCSCIHTTHCVLAILFILPPFIALGAADSRLFPLARDIRVCVLELAGAGTGVLLYILLVHIDCACSWRIGEIDV